MLIAITADGQVLHSPISEKFETCRYLMFVETDSMQYEAVKNNGGSGGAHLAEMIVNRDCEAVITGTLTPPVFNKLADAGITRYTGYGHAVKKAVLLMDRNALEYIRYADENDTCHSEHGGGDCNCGEHED